MRSSLFNLDQEDGQLNYSSRGGCSFWSASPLHGRPPLVNVLGCVWVMRKGVGVGFAGGKGIGRGSASGGVVSDD